ncbi:DUF6286 domain-containing protein [Streptomyces cremeus]|uniref:DUF6286 domain-containing protein n=1 Tax=Streptomyces cremeus TaxID=66881 RepID=A0ABV5PBE5_STRCM
MSEYVPTLEAEREPAVRDGPGTRARFWSARRVPAALTAAVLLAGSGLLLYDVVAVRLGHPGMGWRRELAQALAQRPLEQVWLQVGAGLAVALGLWLVVLAVTPGLRALLPMRAGEAGAVRAGLHRGAAALVLRERAMAVPGVRAARVRVRRARVKVRVVSHFRELDDVRADVGEAMRTGVRDLGLVREPSVAVRAERG